MEEIPPHFTLQGGIEPLGQRTFNVAVVFGKKCDAVLLEMVLEMFVEEFFTFVGLNVHGSSLPYYSFECFCDSFTLFKI